MKKLGLSLIFFVVIGAISLGLGINFYYSGYTDVAPHTNDPIIQTYQQLGQTLARTIQSKALQDELLDSWGDNEKFKLSLIDDAELVLPTTLTSDLLDGKTVTLESEHQYSFYFSVSNTHKTHKILILEAEKPIIDEKNSLRLLLTLSFYLGVIGIIILWLYPLIQRLQKMRKIAIQFGTGDLSARLSLSRYSYISDIEREFNRMAERIHTLMDDNKLLSRAVSHDLKTPLARLRFGFETFQETTDEKKRHKYYARLESDLEEMENLVETLLAYARLEETTISISQNPINLNTILNQAIDKTLLHKHIQLNVVGDCIVLGDRQYLTMLAHNLVSNAIDHGSTPVLITLKASADKVTLCVEDDGTGVSASDRQRICKPFERNKARKNNGKNGHGMGLAIVQRICHWHNASLDITDSANLKGACFSLTFPKYLKNDKAPP